MRLRVVVVATLTGLGVAACSENAPSNGGAQSSGSDTQLTQTAKASPAGPASPERTAPQQPQPSAAAPQQRTATAAPAQSTASDDPIPPADARWTLYCYTVNSQTHVEDSKNLKRALANKTGKRDWYVIHGAQASTLYYGFFRAINDADGAADASRARRERDAVAKIEDSQGNKPFHTCAFVQLSAPDPSSRPEWSLANVDRDKDPKDPTRAYWSLQIMAFMNHPQRKEAAVQAVADLRAMGVDAYYYHGETISSVCVGSWPPSAIKTQHVSNDEKLDGKGVAHAQNPNATLVVTDTPLTNDMIPKAKDEHGNPVVAVAPKLEIMDPAMKATIAKFATHAVNYEIRVKKGASGNDIPDASFLVTIPRPKGNGLFDSDPVAVTPPPVDSPLDRSRGPSALNMRGQSGSRPPEALGTTDGDPGRQAPGRLRSIDR